MQTSLAATLIVGALSLLGAAPAVAGQAAGGGWYTVAPRASRTAGHAPLAGDVPARRQFEIVATIGEIRIDGVIDEDAWRPALAIDLPYEIFPGDNTTPPVQTVCLVVHDDENLYIAFRASDPRPSEIRAHLWDRDQVADLITDDYVGVLIDAFGDDRRAFQFRVNPLGVQADAVNSEVGGEEDWSWDALWTSAGTVTETGYEIEMAIPFSQLRFERTDGPRTWGFVANRSYPRGVRHRISSMYRDRDNSCLLCQSNRLTGFQGVAPGRNLELTPTVTSSRTDRRLAFPAGDLENGTLQAEPGLTTRWGVATNMNLSAALNPDFSHVEADAAQLEANTRFALFFPEKRPFFLEGADFFETPIQAVFTRTVADPSFGAKLTGKVGRNALGVFVTRDRVNNLILPSNQESRLQQVDQSVTGGVLRYRRDVGAGSTLGVLATGRQGSDYHNRVYGADGFLRFSDTDTLQFQYLRSSTAYPEAISARFGQPRGNFAGDGIDLRFEHAGRNWISTAKYRSRSPGFRANYGFVPRVDIRGGDADIARVFWGSDDGWFTQILVGGWYEYREDFSGRLTDRSLGTFVFYHGPLQSEASASVARFTTRFAGQSFDLSGGNVELRIRPTGGFNLGIEVQLGDTIDVTNVRKVDELVLTPKVEFNLGRHFSTALSYVYQRLSLDGDEVLTAHLPQSRLQYTFNTRLFVRAILQYRHTHRNPELFTAPTEEDARQLFAQLLVSYKLNARTVFFLGYSGNNASLTHTDLLATDRTLFLKLSYAWLL